MTRTWDSIEDLSGEDVFDSRDIQEWIDELESELDDYQTDRNEWEGAYPAVRGEEPTPPDDLDAKRETLKALHEIRDACGREWVHGVGYYRDSYFKDYAQELAEECGYCGNQKDNPLFQCIDWDKWAEMVQQDYSSIEVGGVTFWYRD